ncbi:MAG: ArsB/NhaD family transporter [Oceanospirillaceae bacterium]|nr:ArsB/NhaD family transporter [Oceanospirillaceae bacterium]MCP5350574.1 ArsB/NhaD family transporter [Oceanospirillaceae bacterium]
MHEYVFDSHMLVAAIILVITFAGIFTEQLHGFERAKFAMAGAGAMLLSGQFMGFYTPEQAIHSIDWNVIFLLGCMMAIIAIMIPTGGFEHLAYKMAAFSKGRLYLLLVLLGTAVTLLSLLLDNVTTVVIFGPLIILIAQRLGVSPVPYLMAAALLSDTGGVATLVGDPPNLMIGSAAGIDFNTFLFHMGGLVFFAWLVIIIGLKWLFKSELAEKVSGSFDDPHKIKNPKVWYAAMAIMGLMVVLFTLHKQMHWEPWMISALGLTLLLFIARKIELEHTMEHVEVPLLVFFISLFILIGGVEQSHFLHWVGQFIRPLVDENLLLATVALLWGAAFLSALIDNIPFTAAMIPILLGLEQQGANITPLWWALAAGVGMGGNGTHVGSTANVFIVTISERLAKQTGNPAYAITPGVWARKGLPAMLLSLVACTVIMVLFFDFFAAPIK